MTSSSPMMMINKLSTATVGKNSNKTILINVQKNSKEMLIFPNNIISSGYGDVPL